MCMRSRENCVFYRGLSGASKEEEEKERRRSLFTITVCLCALKKSSKKGKEERTFPIIDFFLQTFSMKQQQKMILFVVVSFLLFRSEREQTSSREQKTLTLSKKKREGGEGENFYNNLGLAWRKSHLSMLFSFFTQNFGLKRFRDEKKKKSWVCGAIIPFPKRFGIIGSLFQHEKG